MQLDTLLANNLIIREWLNGSTFPISLILTWLISLYLFNSYMTFGHGWTRKPGVSTGCALWWIFASETLRSVCVWIVIRINNGWIMTEHARMVLNFVFLAAGVILISALLRCTYLFTPPRWGNKIWILSFFITVLIMSTSHFIR